MKIIVTKERELLKEICNLLMLIGIFPNRKGFTAIKYAIFLSVKAYQENVPIDIYKSLSKCLEKSVSLLEANMRSAFKSAKDSNMLNKLNDILGFNVVNNYISLSNLQIIALLTQYVIDNTAVINSAAPIPCPFENSLTVN